MKRTQSSYLFMGIYIMFLYILAVLEGNTEIVEFFRIPVLLFIPVCFIMFIYYGEFSND